MSRWDTVCDLPNSHVSSCIWNHWPSATISVSAFWCLGDRDLISGVLVIAVMVCDLVEVLAVGDEKMLCRPCVDCGLRTGRFCDFCLVADRMPSEVWAEGQLTQRRHVPVLGGLPTGHVPQKQEGEPVP